MTKECVINMIDCILGNDILCDCIEDSPVGCNECRREAADIAINALKEQKTGHWTTKRTLQHDGEWYCDQCEYEPTVFEDTPFCPNCGAKMDGEG